MRTILPTMLLVTTLALTACGSDDADSDDVLALRLPTGDPASQSCLRLADSIPVLAELPTAFAGTVRELADGQVRLDVERWYTADRGSSVVLEDADERLQPLLGATDFAVGEDYLVSAGPDAVVSTCGLTGPAGADLQAAYDEAFGG